MTKTITLKFPQWQGGGNPNYAFGADLLEWLIPKNDAIPIFEVLVNRNSDIKLKVENGVLGESVLLHQLQETRDILKKEKPDKLIILGGDCSIAQEPFDYLHGIYGEKLGIIWLDAHPDISSPESMEHYHAMVLAELLGEGAESFADQVQHPFSTKQILFAGLQESLPHEESFIERHQIERISPESLFENSDKIIEWINKNGFEKVAIHFDLDVLNPKYFRSILPAKPYLEDFPAAIGNLTLA